MQESFGVFTRVGTVCKSGDSFARMTGGLSL
jgi:hypothetical protein